MSRRLLTLFLFLIAPILALAQVTVTMSTPVNGQTYSSPVSVQATASSTHLITGWVIYDNSTQIYSNSGGATLSASIALGNGSHTILARAWDSTGAFNSAQASITVASASITVNVSVPTNGASVSSPVAIQAAGTTANSGAQMMGWHIYVDSVDSWNTSGPTASISASVSMSAGTHSVQVRAWDSTGAYGTATITLTVTSNTVSSPGTVTGTVTDSVSGSPIGGATVSWSGGSTTTPVSTTSTGAVRTGHVFIVAEENHSYNAVVGNTGMPYFNNTLRPLGSLLTNYYANNHPSQPEYLEVTSGGLWTWSPYNCTDAGCSVAIDQDNIVRAIAAAGKTWHGYFEDMPSCGFMGVSNANYVKKHNPFPYYSDVINSATQQQNMCPFTKFSTDLSAKAFANYNFVVPNLQNDAHDGTLTQADTWLQNNIAPLLASSYFQPGGDGVLIIWFDEGNVDGTDNACSSTVSTGCGGHATVLIIGPGISANNQDPTYGQHQSTLRMTLENLGLTDFMNDASATTTDFKEIYSTGTSSSNGTYTLSNVTSGSQTITFAATNYSTASKAVSVPSGGTVTANQALSPASSGGTSTGTSTGAVQGRVLDSVTLNGISGATVSGGGVTTTTTTWLSSDTNLNTDFSSASAWQVNNSADYVRVLSDGAIVLNATEIDAYFAAYGVLGLLEDPARYTTALNWITWYVNHYNKTTDVWGTTGTMYRYNVTNNATGSCWETPCSADSTDSYAAMFLAVCWKAWATGNSPLRTYLSAHQTDIDTIGSHLMWLMDHSSNGFGQTLDGLTWALPNYQIKYLMDNNEVQDGLKAAVNLFNAFGNSTRATTYQTYQQKNLNAILSMWMPSANAFSVQRDNNGDHAPNWSTWYPDSPAQYYPIFLGTISPSDPKAVAVYNNLLSHWPTWYNLPWQGSPTNDPDPWTSAGLTAYMMGNEADLGKYITNIETKYVNATPYVYPWAYQTLDNGDWMMLINGLKTNGMTGYYTLNRPTAGNQTITFSAPGYQSQSQAVSIPSSGTLYENMSLVTGGVQYMQGASSDTSGTSFPTTFSSASSTGDLIIVSTVYGTATTIGVSDNNGNTYTRAIGPVGCCGVNEEVWYAANIATATHNPVTVTVTSSTSESVNLDVQEYAGLAASSPVDKTGSTSAVSSTTCAPSVTTAFSTELVWGRCYFGDTTQVAVPGTGFTGRLVNNNGHANDLAEDEAITSSGTVTATETVAGATTVTGAMVSFVANGTVSSPSSGTGIPKELFGMHVNHYNAPQISIGSFRIWDTGAGWSDLEPSNGTYNWTPLDNVLTLAQNAGATDIIYTFGHTPSWTGTNFCGSPNLTDWDNFINALIAHANGRIRYWEVWNEPNLGSFWCGTTAQLVTMAQHLYNDVKAANPAFQVITPAPAEASTSWMSSYLQAGGNAYADIVGFHYYVGSGGGGPGGGPEVVASAISNMSSTASGNGMAGKPLWITEGGWGKQSDLPDQTQEANFVPRYYATIYSTGVSRFYWYAYDNESASGYWGTLCNNGTGFTCNGLLPAANTYNTVYHWFAGNTLTTPCSANGTIYTCGITNPDGTTHEMVWNTAGSSTFASDPKYTTVTDEFGSTSSINSSQVTIGLGALLLNAPAPTTTTTGGGGGGTTTTSGGGTGTQTTITTSTTLAAETGGDTSANTNWPTSSNGDLSGNTNISKVPIKNLLYSGNTTNVFMNYLTWWCAPTVGTVSTGTLDCGHIEIGYTSDDTTQIHAQLTDIYSRGLAGPTFDWYGRGNQGSTSNAWKENDATLKGIADINANNSTRPLKFSLMLDHIYTWTCGNGAYSSLGYGSLTQCLWSEIDADLDYANTNFFGSTNAYKVNGHPVVTIFITESSSEFAGADWTTVWNTVVSHVASETNGSPYLLFIGKGGNTHTGSNGSFAWTNNMESLNSGYANDDGATYLDDYYNTWVSSFQTKQIWGAGWKGFNDSLASWGSGRLMNQNCGHTWTDSLAQAGKYFSAGFQLPLVQITTWNDYEEGTEVETGINSCNSVTASMSGSTVNWTVGGSGFTDTIDHFTVYYSTDGTNLAVLQDNIAPTTRSLTLSNYAIGTGTFYIFVKLVSVNTLSNAMSTAQTYLLNDAPPTATLSISPVTGTIPLTVSVDTSGSFDSDGSITKRVVDWGDGSTPLILSGLTASHTYTVAGIFPVTLTVTDNVGLTAATSANVSTSSAATSNTAIFTLLSSGGYVYSPVRITGQITAKSPPITHARIYVDGAIVYDIAYNGAVYNVDKYVFMSGGAWHTIMLEGVDNSGNKWDSAVIQVYCVGHIF